MKHVPAPAAGCRRRFLLPALLLPLFAGCAGGPPLKSFPALESSGIPQEIEGVPFYPQEALQCGPAALATVLGWSGKNVSPSQLEPRLYLPERRGTLQVELKAQARHYGRIPYEIPPDPSALVEEIVAGHPVLVLQNNGLGWAPAWHYAVVVGMNPADETVRLRSGEREDYDLEYGTFLRTWARSEYWGVVALPPDRMPASLRGAPVLSAITNFARVGDSDAVRQALSSAVAKWPEDVGLRFALANHWYSEGEFENAETEYRRILSFAPDAVMARNNLAWLLAEQGRTDEAHEMLPDDPERTAQELPQDPWAKSLADTAAFVRCREAGGSVENCEAVPRPVEGARNE
ncbi:MAG: PA2778 family cysteine peptidase [Proteobacteria bacterium]|nr:PA2778 family cysteine peptidase [Pseudomonadota bacterium]